MSYIEFLGLPEPVSAVSSRKVGSDNNKQPHFLCSFFACRQKFLLELDPRNQKWAPALEKLPAFMEKLSCAFYRDHTLGSD